MKRILNAFFLMVCFLFSGFSQEVSLILHRVYFEPVNLKVKEDTELFSTLPDLLYSLITTIQPIVRTEEKDEARSIVAITVLKKGKSEMHLTIALLQGEKQTDSTEFVYQSGQLDYFLLKKFMDATAKKFSTYLGEVKPEVQEISMTRDIETKNIIRTVRFTEAMSKPFELNAWIGSFLKANTSHEAVEGFTLQPMILFPFPLQVDLVWYFEKQQGLIFTLYFDYNDYMFFGYKDSATEDIGALSENMIFLAGSGYVFRTLGVFSTSYSISLLLGAVNVKAKEKLVNHNSGQISLSEGESIWLFITSMPFRISFIYNITPELALQTNFALIFNPYMLFTLLAGIPMVYEGSGSAVQVQFFTLGVAYRF
jgi:hypothetical protein